MKAIIKNLHSLEIEDNLSVFTPKDSQNFGSWVRASIGPANEVGAENFDIFVCTPQWLARKCKEDGPTCGRHMLVVSEYSMSSIASSLQNIVAQQCQTEWKDTAIRLRDFFAWEFEDYHP